MRGGCIFVLSFRHSRSIHSQFFHLVVSHLQREILLKPNDSVWGQPQTIWAKAPSLRENFVLNATEMIENAPARLFNIRDLQILRRERLRASTRFDFRVFLPQTPQKPSLHFFFSPENLALLSLLKEVKPSSGRKMTKPLTFFITRFPHYTDISCKNSYQNDDDFLVFPPK